MIFRLATDPEAPFPDTQWALQEPNGLLALGGDLQPARLLHAYRQGIFPWFGPHDPILWWTPDPRLVLYPGNAHLARRLARTLRRQRPRLTADQCFEAVIDGCAAPRPGQPGTWITPPMRTAYCRLYRLGYAHSVEVWYGSTLAGGLYGVVLGRAFFAESMFSRQTDASKTALLGLSRQLREWQFTCIDCQLPNPHLERMGAVAISRARFESLLGEAVDNDAPDPGEWAPAFHSLRPEQWRSGPV
mgnify:CR=1 FL=1